MVSVELSKSTYDRLAARAKGFDTPEQVILRLLDEVEGKSGLKKPSLSFFPGDEKQFKEELVKHKVVEIVLTKQDGSEEVVFWNAHRFTSESNLRANLWSGHLRNWKEKGITEAALTVIPVNSPVEQAREVREHLWIAEQLSIPYSESVELYGFYDIDLNEAGTANILRFSSDAPKEIVSKITDSDWVEIELCHDEEEPDFS